MQLPSATKQLPWWELQFTVPYFLADDIGASLMATGAAGVAVTRELDAHRQHASLGPVPAMGNGPMGEVVTPEADTQLTVRVVATYPQTLSYEEVLACAEEGLEELGETGRLAEADLRQRSDNDWAFAWRQHFKPIKIGRRLWVVPSWEKEFLPPQNSVVLHLDPGMAFGTGQHASTALCLRAIENHLTQLEAHTRQKLEVLDVGCGSGILALGALALGAHRVTAIDIDEDSVAATRANMHSHGFFARSTVSHLPVGDIKGQFDLVIANILAPVLIDLADGLIARLKSGGLLLVSGLLTEQAPEVTQALLQAARRKKMRLTALRPYRHDDWSALLFEATAKG